VTHLSASLSSSLSQPVRSFQTL